MPYVLVYYFRASSRAATILMKKQPRSITLSQADCLVAAAAATRRAVLATGNPDDFPMKGVEVEHWPVGE